jgi:hypothetical protein
LGSLQTLHDEFLLPKPVIVNLFQIAVKSKSNISHPSRYGERVGNTLGAWWKHIGNVMGA